MPKKMVLIGLIGSTMLMSGCSRSRAFTRGDYSEMQDPFMGGVADSSAAELADSGTGPSGKASLDSDSGTAGVGGQETLARGPRPIQQVGGTADPAGSSGAVSRAVYPSEELEASSDAVPAGRQVIRSYEGPALSGFLQGRRPETAEPNGGMTAGNSILQRQTAAPGLTKNSMMSPAAQAAALPGMSAEVEGFSSFLKDSSDQVVNDAETAVQDAKASAASFSEFAAQKKAQWQQQAQAAPDAAKQSVVQAKDAVRQRKDAFIEQINAGGVGGAAAAGTGSTAVSAGRPGNASPGQGWTVKTGNTANSSKDPATDSAEAEAVTNPFAEMPEFSTEEVAPEESSDEATFDEAFGGESNWKPKEFTP
jgi:hypothetical protein